MNLLPKLILTVGIAVLVSMPSFSQTEEEETDTTSQTVFTFDTSLVKVDSTQLHRPRIGLTFAGGGAKGAAHIGVLKVLEEVGIPIDYITGTSMGSIIGMLYSLGYTANQMDSIISRIDWGVYMTDRVDRRYTNSVKTERQGTYLMTLPFNTGTFSSKMDVLEEDQDISKGEKTDLEKETHTQQNATGISFLSSLPGGFTTGSNLLNLFNCLSVGYQEPMDFNDLPIPFACVVSDVVSGQPKVLRSGRLAEAVRASMAIPGVFAPVPYGDDMMLIDGGIFNNFPVNVCQDMGADIVIGVEVTKDRGEVRQDAIRSLPELLTRLFDMLTRKGTAENQERCTIYIHPDISGFGTLSFSEENVKAIIDRGYQAASEQRDMLLALRELLDHYPQEEERQAPSAKNLTSFSPTSIKVTAYTVEGLDAIIGKRMMEKADIDFTKPVTGADLDRLMGLINGTGAFESINYYLSPLADGTYHLTIKTTPSEPHSIAFGARFDTEDYATLLLHLGLGENKLTGWKSSTTWALGANMKGNVTASYSPRIFPTINMALNYSRNENLNTVMGVPISKSDKKEYSAEFFASQFHSRYIQVEGGLCLQSRVLSSVFYDEDYTRRAIEEVTEETKSLILDDFGGLEEWSSNRPLSLFYRMKFDNLDKATFATKGTRFQVFADWYITEYDPTIRNNGTTHPSLGDLQINYERYMPLSDKLVFKPQFYARTLIGKDKDNDHYITYKNYMGGSMAGRYSQQQMPFIGINNVESMGDIATIFRADLQCELKERHYLTAMLNYAHDADKISEWFGNKQSSGAFGAGLQYAYNSVAGPISVDIHWSNLHSQASFRNQLGFYLNFGHSF